jgi:hypothetical protein
MTDCFIFPLDAHRVADAHNLHVLADRSNVGHWIAVRLADGTSDGAVYDHRREAVSHQLDEKLCAYIKLHPCMMTPKEGASVLKFYRVAYDAGFKVTDPEGPEIIMPATTQELNSQIARLSRR